MPLGSLGSACGSTPTTQPVRPPPGAKPDHGRSAPPCHLPLRWHTAADKNKRQASPSRTGTVRAGGEHKREKKNPSLLKIQPLLSTERQPNPHPKLDVALTCPSCGTHHSVCHRHGLSASPQNTTAACETAAFPTGPQHGQGSRVITLVFNSN